MALELFWEPVTTPGSSGSNPSLKIAIALYRDGVIQPKTTWDGTNGSSKMEIVVSDEGSIANIESFDATDFTEATAAGGADHYYATKSVTGVTGAQLIGFKFDINWDDGVNPNEDLDFSSFRATRY